MTLLHLQPGAQPLCWTVWVYHLICLGLRTYCPPQSVTQSVSILLAIITVNSCVVVQSIQGCSSHSLWPMTFYNKCVCILSALPYMCTACMPYICRYHCGYSFKCVIFLLFQGSINPRVHWPISLPVNCNKSSVQRTLQRSVVASVNSVVLLDLAFRGAKPKYPGGLDIVIRQKWCQKWDSDTVRPTSRTLWARWTPG